LHGWNVHRGSVGGFFRGNRLFGGEIVGVFVVVFKADMVGLGDISKLLATKHVAIGFRTDVVITVIYTGNGDLREEGGVGWVGVFNGIGNVEYIIEVGPKRDVIDKSELFCADVACNTQGVAFVALVFNATKVGLIVNEANVIGFGEKEKAFLAIGVGVKIDVIGKNTGIITGERGCRLRNGAGDSGKDTFARVGRKCQHEEKYTKEKGRARPKEMFFQHGK